MRLLETLSKKINIDIVEYPDAAVLLKVRKASQKWYGADIGIRKKQAMWELEDKDFKQLEVNVGVE